MLKSEKKSKVIVFILSISLFAYTSQAWDSSLNNPTKPTHTYITEWAINNSSKVDPDVKKMQPELQANRAIIIDGSNQELHELVITGTSHELNLETLRVKHKGTNAGCDDIQGYWSDITKAYKENKKDQAYFLLGIMLHMIEDMGVPAHANGVHHQGNRTEFDNFEFMALSNWNPIFPDNSTNPNYTDPSQYYQFSKNWAHNDAPNYNDRNSFSKIWTLASPAERSLLQNREGRTSRVTLWTLESALRAFSKL